MCKSFTVNSAVLLPKNEYAFNSNIVRLNNSRIDASKTKSHLFWRSETVIIKNSKGGQIIRSIAGTPGSLRVTKDAIAIDYDGRSSLGILGIEDNVPCELTVRPANVFEITKWYLNHPDTGYQLATRIAVLGLFMGVMGLLF